MGMEIRMERKMEMEKEKGFKAAFYFLWHRTMQKQHRTVLPFVNNVCDTAALGEAIATPSAATVCNVFRYIAQRS